jgi:hypothetical protein
MKTYFPNPLTSSAASAQPVAAHIDAFRECYSRYQECLEFRGVPTQSDAQETIENFILDFELTGRRVLGAASARFQLFKMRYLQGWSAQDCCRLTRTDRFSLAQELRALESLLGNAFSQRGLFPLIAYFGTGAKPGTGASFASPECLAA